MNLKIIENKKEEIQIEIDNLTVAELVRNYLWQDPTTVVSAWQREHPSKNPRLILHTKGKSAKKVLQQTINKIQATNSKLLSEFKKIKL